METVTTMKQFIEAVHEGEGIEAVGTVEPDEPNAKQPGKTPTLPGMEDQFVRIPEVSDALEKLKEIRKMRMDFTKQETAAQDLALQLMHAHGIESYKDDSFDPPLTGKIVKGKEKCKVTMKDDDDGEDED